MPINSGLGQGSSSSKGGVGANISVGGGTSAVPDGHTVDRPRPSSSSRAIRTPSATLAGLGSRSSRSPFVFNNASFPRRKDDDDDGKSAASFHVPIPDRASRARESGTPLSARVFTRRSQLADLTTFLRITARYAYASFPEILRRVRRFWVYFIVATILLYVFSNVLLPSGSFVMSFVPSRGKNKRVREEEDRVARIRNAEMRKVERGDLEGAAKLGVKVDATEGARRQEGGHAAGHHQRGSTVKDEWSVDITLRRKSIRDKYGPNGENNAVALQNSLLETCLISRQLARQQWATCRIVASIRSGNTDTETAENLRGLIAANQRATAENVAKEADHVVRLLAEEKGMLTHAIGDEDDNEASKVHTFTPHVERLWEECSWDSMAPIHRGLWHQMGFDGHAWDSGVATAVDSNKPFDSLSLVRQYAALCLGYTPSTW